LTATTLLTRDDLVEIDRIDRALTTGKPSKRPSIVWQESHSPLIPFTETREWLLRCYPRTQLSDGTMGRWLIQEWPGVDYPAEPLDFDHADADGRQIALF
jgi:hypothetical protein